MDETNQVSCEAVESSCDQVTPDSNQDKSLSLMRYKDLQQLAMSLNLPGNLKRKTLVDLITAKRSNRDEDVESIITEYRVNRKSVVKRNREADERSEETEESCMVASHFMEPSGSDYGSSHMGEGSATSTRNGDRPRKKRGGNPGTEEVATTSSTPAQGPLVSGEMQNAYVAQVAYPYRYAVQASSASILASILSSNASSQALQLKSQLGCNPIHNYGIVSTVPVSNNNINSNNQFSSTEADNYKNMAAPQLSSNFPSIIGKDLGPCTPEFTQNDMYSSIHQQPQLTSESNYVAPYAITHPAYATLTHYTNIPNSHAHLQQPSFAQPDSGNGGSLVCFGYPQQTDTPSNEAMNSLVGKQSVAQVYGQKIFSNQRLVDNGYTLSLLDDASHKHNVHAHLSYAVSPSPALSINPAKCWENGNVTSTSTVSQEMHNNCPPVFGNINAIWHYQGLPLNYNNASAGSSVMAHDLTVPSRRSSQEGALGNFSLAKGPSSHAENLEDQTAYPNHSEGGAVPPYHPPRIDSEGENSSERPSTYPLNRTEPNHSIESMEQMQQPLQCGENKTDGNPSPVESNSGNEGVEHSGSLSTSQVNVHEASESPQEPVSRDVQSMSYTEESNMSYWSNIYPPMKTGHSPRYSSGFNPQCESVYGVVPPNGNTLPCSECDIAKYSQQSTSYQTLVNPNSCQSSPVQSAQYSHSMGTGHDYHYGQRPYGPTQNSYSPYPEQEKAVEIDSTSASIDNSDGYLQEQQDAENYSRSYVTPNSMESMWSSGQSSSNDFDNPLVTSSPVGNELEGGQDSCMEGVFPDEGDLEMEDEHGLAFPNIYDYVMGSAEGEAEAALSAKIGEEPNGEGESPTSPESSGESCDQEKKRRSKDEALAEDPVESAHPDEESDGTRNDSESVTSPSKDDLNTSGRSTLSENSSKKHNQSSSYQGSSLRKDKTSKKDKGTPVVSLKRRNQSSRGKSSKMHHYRMKGGKGGRSTSPRRYGSRGKAINRKDIISCPCDQESCTWVGRIPTMASHVRSAHQEKVLSVDDTSLTVDIKELNQKNHSTFFQEAGGTLYMIAVHKKKEQIFTTIQSLPGSARGGIHLNGTKASLEVLLKDGNSQGWRGRVWSILAPSSSNQKAVPHSPASLQERLWSRGDYLSVELSNICELKVGTFRLYISITPGQVHSLNSSFTDDDMSCKMDSSQTDPLVDEPSADSLQVPDQDDDVPDKMIAPSFDDNCKTITHTSSNATTSSSTTNPSSAGNSLKATNPSSGTNSSNAAHSAKSVKSSNADSSGSAVCIQDNNPESKSESTTNVSTLSSEVV